MVRYGMVVLAIKFTCLELHTIRIGSLVLCDDVD